jgi:hypothetical protein
MKVYHRVWIVPALPKCCVSEDDLRRLAQFGFYPQKKEGDNDRISFMAPIYVYDQGDHKYSSLDNDGSSYVSAEENSLYGILVRIMDRAGLSYVCLTKIGQLIYKENMFDKI